MTLMSVSAVLPAVKTTPLVLEPVRHARWPRCLLVPGRHRIGSGAENPLRIDVAGVAIDHAIIVVGADRVILKAWDRRTWVNEGPVQECELRLGDRVTIGPCSWLVCNATTDDLLSGWPTQAARSETPAVTPTETVPTPSLETLPATTTVDAENSVVPAALSSAVNPPTDSVTASTEPPVADTHTVSDTVEPSHYDTEADDLLRLQEELLQLRHELDDARSTWRQETHRRELELATESAQLTRRGAALERADHDLQRSRQELEGLRVSLAARDATLQKSEQQLADLQQGLLAERQRLEVLSEATRNELQQETARQTAAWREWEVTQARLLSDLAEQSSDLEQRRHDLQLERSRLTEERIDFEHVQREFRQAQREFLDEREAWLAETSAWEVRCHARDEQHANVQHQLQRQQEQLTADLHERARSQADFLQAQQQLQHERRLFADQQTAWIQERETLWSELREQRTRLDRETQHLESTQHKLDELQAALEAELSSWKAAQVAAESHQAESPAAEIETPLVTELIDAEILTPPIVAEIEVAIEEAIETDSNTDIDSLDDSVSEFDDETTSADFEAVQAALDALAARFEEFSELEQRLSNKHDELRDLQEDLAVREAALNAQTLAWQQEHAEWQVEIASDLARREAWEISRQAEAAVMLAERRLWTPPSEPVVPSVIDLPAAPTAEDEPIATCDVPQSELVIDPVEVAPLEASSLTSFAETVADPAPALSTSAFADEFITNLAEPQLQPPPLPTEMDHTQTVAESAPDSEGNPQPEIASAELLLPADETPITSENHAETLTEIAWEPQPDHSLASTDSVTQELLWNLPPIESGGPAAEEQAPAATPTEDEDLRSRLAAMFGLPDDFAQRPAAPPVDTTDEVTATEPLSSADYLDSVFSPPNAETTEAPTATTTAADESWRDRLNELLTTQQSESSAVETADEIPPSIEAVQSPAVASVAQEEDSVSAYMERLLARTRRNDSDVTRPDTEPTPVAVVSEPEAAEEPEFHTDRVVTPPQPIEPRKRLDSQATRMELQSFREVANLSARAALAKHSWETTKTEFGIQLGITSFSTVAAVYYWSAPLLGRAIAWGPALGCTLAAGFVGWRACQSWRRFSQITTGSEAPAPDDIAGTETTTSKLESTTATDDVATHDDLEHSTAE